MAAGSEGWCVIDQDVRLAVVWMFLLCAWFTVVGYFTATGSYVTAIAQAVVGVFAAYAHLQTYYDDRVKLYQLRQRMNQVIPVKEYEVRRERGIRILVGYLRGEDQ